MEERSILQSLNILALLFSSYTQTSQHYTPKEKRDPPTECYITDIN